MKARILILLLFALMFIHYLRSQEPLVIPRGPEVKLTAKADSTQVQLAYEKQKNLQLQSQLLQQQYQKQMADMQKQFNDHEKAIQDWVAVTKKANGFGDDVSYDRDQDKWFKADRPKTAKSALK